MWKFGWPSSLSARSLLEHAPRSLAPLLKGCPPTPDIAAQSGDVRAVADASNTRTSWRSLRCLPAAGQWGLPRTRSCAGNAEIISAAWLPVTGSEAMSNRLPRNCSRRSIASTGDPAISSAPLLRPPSCRAIASLPAADPAATPDEQFSMKKDRPMIVWGMARDWMCCSTLYLLSSAGCRCGDRPLPLR